MQCPRCHTINSWEARFCGQCGLPLQSQAALLQPAPPAPIPAAPTAALTGIATVAPLRISPNQQTFAVAIVQHVPSPAEGQPATVYPYSPVPGRSVLAALAVHRSPTSIFWFGLFGLGGTLLCCPAGSAVFLLAPQGTGIDTTDRFRTSVLLFSGCSFLIAVLLAGLFLFIGRPRRAS